MTEKTVNVPRDQVEKLYRFLSGLCDGSPLSVPGSRFLMTDNPAFTEDNGEDPRILIDVQDWMLTALSAAPLHEDDWSELERLAREAMKRAPGQWERDTEKGEGEYGLGDDTHSGFMVPYVMDGCGRRLFDAHASEIALIEEDHSFDENGADYSSWDQASCEVLDFSAAANPATILKLIASARSVPPPSVEVSGPPIQMLYELRHPTLGRVGWEDNAALMAAAADEIEAVYAPRSPPSVEVERLREALERLTVMRDQARDGTPVTDPNEWEADELTAIIGLLSLSRKQEPSEWIEWSGGENPVPGKAVEVKFRGMHRPSIIRDPADWIWVRKGDGDDIIAYRIVPTPGGEE